jgi:hypothetical protein
VVELFHIPHSPKAPRLSHRRLIGCALAVGLALSLAACGGGGEKTVATIAGHTKVSQAMLNHWMVVVLGGDYRAALGELAPEGLVSDPPDYGRCVAVAGRIAPKVGGKPVLSRSQLQLKCRQLNAGIREQTLNYVLSVLWARERAAELGLRMPSEGEISSRLRALIYGQFKDPQNFRKVIAGQRRSIADVRFLIKRNLLEGEIDPHVKAQAKRRGEGPRGYYKLVLQSNAKWQARTSCSPGYQAWECKQYSGHEAKPPPAVVLEHLQKGVG